MTLFQKKRIKIEIRNLISKCNFRSIKEEKLFMNTGVLLVLRKPNFVFGAIANILGIIYNALFNFIYGISTNGSLGIAIILFTIIVKFILFPLMIKQQRSSFKLQQLQPEMNKIRAKYKDKKDQLSQQIMALELQEFQKKNGISMLSGCLPLLIQLPILYALFYIFQQAYLYVDVIAQNYTEITNVLNSAPETVRTAVFQPYLEFWQSDMLTKALEGFSKAGYDANMIQNFALIDSFKSADWTYVLDTLGEHIQNLPVLLQQKSEIEMFLGISLINNPGLSFPGIFVPILAAATTWGQSKIMQQLTNNTTDPNDPAAAMTNSMTNTMLYVMPIMMGVMTISVPAALGLYWVVSNLISIVQQLLLKKYFRKKFEGEAQQNG